MVGAWAVGESSVEVNIGEPSYISTISFASPLPAGIPIANTHFIPAYNAGGGDPPPAIPAPCDDGEAPPPNVDNPEADPGHLCVFTADAIFIPPFFENGPSLGDNVEIHALGGEEGASKTGAMLAVAVATGGNYYGSWAVTPPAE